MAWFKCVGPIEGGSDLIFKKYAYFDGSFGLHIGEQYETDALMLNSNYKTELKFYEIEYVNGKYILGSMSGSYYSILLVGNNNFQCSRGNTYTVNLTSYSTGEHVFVENDDNGYCSLDNIVSSVAYNLDSSAENKPTRIRTIGHQSDAHNSTGSGAFWKGYVEYLKVTDKTTGNLIHHIRPVIFNNIAYMYDEITNRLYYTQGLTVMDEIPTT